MSVPVATARKSFLPLRLRSTVIVGPRPTLPMPSVSENNNKASLTVGDHVLVNGLKSGILRYIGTVQFAQGLFCGVELDQPDGKHDGQVKDIRYFQCAPNHGIFVPRDKVVLAPRTRASSSQKPISRLRPPTMTRSITLSSSINKIEQSTSVQLPDIVPNSTTQPVILNQPIVIDNHDIIISTEQPKEETMNIVEPKLEFQPLPIDEPPETIEADFTDSVSLILHQLQQKERIEKTSSSTTISEDNTDDDDELDSESIVESTIDEQTDTTRRSSCASSVFIPIDITKSIQTDLSFNSNDKISFTKIQLSTPVNKKKPIIQPIKKNIERRPVVPVINITKRPITGKPTITPSKKGSISKTQLNPAHSVTSLPSRSKLSLSLSSCNSLNSSQSDVASINKNPKQVSGTMENKCQLINVPPASSEKKLDESHHILTVLNQSLEANNQHLKKYYQHLLNQFDLMSILNQYYLNENEQIQQKHELQLSKARTRNDRLQNSIEQIQLSHQNELSSLDKQYQLQIEILNKTHEQQLNEYQQKTDHLLHEKTELESRCLLLQEKVDSFLTEMANSEHADVLLCHVETLEKDRTSLQTVLELKNKEIAQLRTKINEQEIKLSDEQTLQKRITMAENRIQDLEWLLREKQLSEKAAVMERDQLKERIIHFERDNCQLKFENETLHYRLRERSLSVSIPSDNPIKVTPIPPRKVRVHHRAYSLSTRIIISHENERMTRSLSSLYCILNR